METLRNWALSIALAALAGGIVWLLAPKGSVQKALRTVVAVFLLCAFLQPIAAMRGFSLEWLLPEDSTAPAIPGFDETVSEQLRAAVEEEIRARIQSVLDERKISGQIVLDTDILPDGGINIATAQVVLPAGTNTAGLAFALKEAAGLDVAIDN